MPLTEEQDQGLAPASYQELTEALCAAFDHDSLEQTVRFKLGKDLYHLVPRDQGLPTTAFRLIQVAQQEGWTEALIQAVCAARPNNPKVRAFAQGRRRGAAPPPEPAQQVRAVKAGLEAFADIIRQVTDAAIQRTVGEFRAHFEATREKIETLALYKALHDHLHTVGTQSLDALTQAAAAGEARPDAAQLQRSALLLKSCARRVRQVAQRLPRGSRDREEDWIEAEEQAADLVLRSLGGGDDAPLRLGLKTLRGVLAQEPSRLAKEVGDAAEQLRLERLIEVMRKIRKHLDRAAGGDTGGLPLVEFEAGLEGLVLLQPRLAGLVQEHFEWQRLANALALADRESGSTPEERIPRWPNFRARLLRLCGASAEEDWARELTALVRGLEEPGQFTGRYNAFRTVAGDRFFNLDAELLDLCGELTGLTEPLNLLLRLVNDGQGG